MFIRLIGVFGLIGGIIGYPFALIIDTVLFIINFLTGLFPDRLSATHAFIEVISDSIYMIIHGEFPLNLFY
jgi:nicotinamide riboside transporter PnuC